MSEKINGLYSAKDNAHADLICKFGMSREEIRDITDPYLSPIPGELKMVSIKRDISMEYRNGIYIAGPDSDGWVYPDGSWFMCCQFPEISAEYASSSTAKIFQVPVINEFIKSASNSDTYKQEQPAVNVISSHTHKISKTGTITTEMSLNKGYHILASSGCSKQEFEYEAFSDGKGGTVTVKIPKAHNGDVSDLDQSGRYRKRWMDMSIDASEFSLLFQNTESDYTGNIDAPFEPASYNQLIMLYLGKPQLDQSVPDVKIYNVAYYDGKYYKYDQHTNSYETSPYITKTESLGTTQTATDGTSNAIIRAPSYEEYDYICWDPPIESITSDTETYAKYMQKLFNVSFSYTDMSESHEDIQQLKTVRVGYGQSVLEAELDELQRKHPYGHTFSRWSSNQYKNVTNNRTIIANYAPNEINVEAQAIDESGNAIPDAATFIGQGAYLYGVDIILRTIPNQGYRFVKWIYNGEEISDKNLTVHVRGIEHGTITVKAQFETYIIDSIQFYYPYTVSEISSFTVNKNTNSSKVISMTSTIVKKGLTDIGCTADNTYYVKVEWGDGSVNYYDYNKSISHTYATAGAYDIKIIGMQKELISEYSETVPGQGDDGYRIFVDLNGAKPAKKQTSSWILYDGGTTKTKSTAFNGFLPAVTSDYKCVICKIKCADGSEIIENGILRNETSTVNSQYYYMLNNTVTRKGIAYDSIGVNYLPCDNYVIYADSSCTKKASSFDLTAKYTVTTSIATGKPKVYVYGVNPMWIPFGSEIDCEGSNGLVFRNVW